MGAFADFLRNKWNTEHGITPETIREQGVKNMAASTRAAETRKAMVLKSVTVKIQVNPTWCKILTMGPALGAMVNTFKVFNPKARYSPWYIGNGGQWDGYVTFVNEKDGSFGIGMLPEILEFCTQHEIPVEIDDRRGALPSPQYLWDWQGYELKDYQAKIVATAKRAGIGIVKAATGSGKTISYLKLICELGLNTLITVPTSDLMRQTYKVATDSIINAKIGMFGDGITPPDNAQIIIATQATLLSLYKKAGKKEFAKAMSVFGVIISDEVHKVTSGGEITKAFQVIMQVPAPYRFGFSATPYDDPNSISAWYLKQSFGSLIFEMDAQEAQDKGIIVPFTVYSYKLDYPAHYGMNHYVMDEDANPGEEWKKAYDEYIIANTTRNNHILDTVKRLIARKHKVLVVAQRIGHNDLLTTVLRNELGDEAVYQFHGGTKRRTDVLNTFAEIHGPSVLVASSIANDGIDIKDITAIVVATAGASFYQVVQRVGRGLRTYEGKKELVVIDYDDSDLGRWFQKHYRERVKRYRELGGKVVPCKQGQ